MPTSKYKLLIFDWDGTLVDSIERIATSLQAASRKVCQIKVSNKAARDVIGLGLREAIEKLHPHLEPEYIVQISDAYKHHYINDNLISEDPFDGVALLLNELKDRGYYMAVATGKSRVGFDNSMNKHALNECFHSTQCTGENKSKPHPEMLHKILDEFNVKTEDAIMIGDSIHDMKMAQNAGMDSIAVTHGVHTADELSQYKPLTCLNKITDLSDFLHHN